MMGMEFFFGNAPQPFLSVMGSFIGHFIYGAILGAMAGEQARRAAIVEKEIYEERAPEGIGSFKLFLEKERR